MGFLEIVILSRASKGKSLEVYNFFSLNLNFQDPPERPKGKNPPGMVTENFQRWTMSGTVCPEGTIPIRRTREQDMMRASSVKRFGRKLRRHVRRDSSSNGHEVSACNMNNM